MRITRYWIPVLLGFSLIFYLSSLRQDQLPQIEIPYLDKFVHWCLYTLLGFLVARALTSKSRNDVSWRAFRSSIVISVAIVTTYGALDEWHQSYTPGRAVELLDLLADFIGAVSGALLVLPYRRWILGLYSPQSHE